MLLLTAHSISDNSLVIAVAVRKHGDEMAFRLLLVDCILHRGLNAVWCRSSLLFHDRGMDPTESRLSNGSKHKDSLPFFRKSPLSESRSCCKRSWTLSRKLVLAIGTAGRNVPNLMSQLFAETKKGRNRSKKKTLHKGYRIATDETYSPFLLAVQKLPSPVPMG